MKKKFSIIILVSIIIVFVTMLSFIVVWACLPSKKLIENQQYVDEKSKIENFLNIKTDFNYVVVARVKSKDSKDADYSYHIDEEYELYTLLNEMQYEEINDSNNLSSLYDIHFVSKNKGSSSGGYPRTFEIMTNYVIETSAVIFSYEYSASKTRIYKVNEDDYNKIVAKIEYILENYKTY